MKKLPIYFITLFLLFLSSNTSAFALTLKVATFNMGDNDSKISESQRKEVGKWIGAHDYDIIFLQEVFQPDNYDSWFRVGMGSAKSAQYYGARGSYYGSGAIIYSKWPLSNCTGHWPLPEHSSNEYFSFFSCEVTVDGTKYYPMNVHTLPKGFGEYDAWSKHLVYIDYFRESGHGFDPNKLILAGDFNMSYKAPYFSNYLAYWENACPFDRYPDCKSTVNIPNIIDVVPNAQPDAIDFILMPKISGKTWRVDETEIFNKSSYGSYDVSFSDHYAMYSKVTLVDGSSSSTPTPTPATTDVCKIYGYKYLYPQQTLENNVSISSKTSSTSNPFKLDGNLGSGDIRVGNASNYHILYTLCVNSTSCHSPANIKESVYTTLSYSGCIGSDPKIDTRFYFYKWGDVNGDGNVNNSDIDQLSSDLINSNRDKIRHDFDRDTNFNLKDLPYLVDILY